MLARITHRLGRLFGRAPRDVTTGYVVRSGLGRHVHVFAPTAALAKENVERVLGRPWAELEKEGYRPEHVAVVPTARERLRRRLR